MKNNSRANPCISCAKEQVKAISGKSTGWLGAGWLSRMTALLLILFLLVATTSCGAAGSSVSRNDMYTQTSAASEAVPPGEVVKGFADGVSVAPTYSESLQSTADKGNGGTGNINQPPSAPGDLGRKLIRDGNADMETVAFENTVNGLYEMVKIIGGFVEAQSIQGGGLNYSTLRKAAITVRVPSAKFNEAMFGLAKLGTVVSQSTNSTDITDQYADTETRVRNLKIQETRILELIMKAVKLEEIVNLEGRLSELRYQIESMENSLKNFDRLLEYSRISLQISEVVKVSDAKPVPKTLGERISQAFDSAWTGFVEGSQDFAVWMVRNMFTLLILVILSFILYLMVRGSRRKRKAAKEERARLHPSFAQPVGQGPFPMGSMNQAGQQNPNGPMNQAGPQNPTGPMNQAGPQNPTGPMNQAVNPDPQQPGPGAVK